MLQRIIRKGAREWGVCIHYVMIFKGLIKKVTSEEKLKESDSVRHVVI